MTDFVVGLFFDMKMEEYVAIQKRKGSKRFPEQWNGVGGRIKDKIEHWTIRGGESTYDELPETPHRAMSREFQEEAGVFIPDNRWHCFHIQNWQHTKNKVYWFYAAGPEIREVKTTTDEQIALFSIYDFGLEGPDKFVYDLSYHVQMVKTHVRAGDIFCLNPEGINIEKQNPDGVMGSPDNNDTVNEHSD